MKHRKLRIVWSVAWGIAAVLLVALWVRSYTWRDHKILDVNTANGRWIHVISMHGRASFAFAHLPVWINAPRNPKADYVLTRMQFTEGNRSERIHAEARPPILNSLVFEWHWFDDGILVILPYWSLVLTLTTFAFVPWMSALKWRFTTRSLLIATTLVAVVLELIVWIVS